VINVEHRDIPIDWEENQYDTFQEIKQENKNNPDWKAPTRVDPLEGNQQINLKMSPILLSVAQEYAKKQGVSFAKLVRETLCDAVCNDEDFEAMLDAQPEEEVYYPLI